jgi:hypothetical protein
MLIMPVATSTREARHRINTLTTTTMPTQTARPRKTPTRPRRNGREREKSPSAKKLSNAKCRPLGKREKKKPPKSDGKRSARPWRKN